MEFLLIIIAGIVCGFFCEAVAEAKNRPVLGWFLAGFFFSIIALLAIVGMPVKEKEKTERIQTGKKAVAVRVRDCYRIGELVGIHRETVKFEIVVEGSQKKYDSFGLYMYQDSSNFAFLSYLETQFAVKILNEIIKKIPASSKGPDSCSDLQNSEISYSIPRRLKFGIYFPTEINGQEIAFIRFPQQTRDSQFSFEIEKLSELRNLFERSAEKLMNLGAELYE
jgi:hypothetical protein